MSLFFGIIRPSFEPSNLKSWIHLSNLNGYQNLEQLAKFVIMCQSDQLPVGLIAQSVEHCTDIAEVMGSNPVHTLSFFQALISQLLKLLMQLRGSIMSSHFISLGVKRSNGEFGPLLQLVTLDVNYVIHMPIKSENLHLTTVLSEPA